MAVVANTGCTVVFDGFTAERGNASPYDIGFQTITDYCVRDSQNTIGGVLRIGASDSTQDCPPDVPAARW